ncbi:hypothetical protein M885DRAFT_526036 [Pelagophyceae sp. CCMP2097]|nr:hypothetical protein M885DRAFT_526036 [Pelagophyceae sp. CCMP2097]
MTAAPGHAASERPNPALPADLRRSSAAYSWKRTHESTPTARRFRPLAKAVSDAAWKTPTSR